MLYCNPTAKKFLGLPENTDIKSKDFIEQLSYTQCMQIGIENKKEFFQETVSSNYYVEGVEPVPLTFTKKCSQEFVSIKITEMD